MSETHFDRSDWATGKRRRTQLCVHDRSVAMANRRAAHQPRQAGALALHPTGKGVAAAMKGSNLCISQAARAAKAGAPRKEPETNWRGQRNKAVSRGNITEWVLPVRPSTISAEVIELRRYAAPLIGGRFGLRSPGPAWALDGPDIEDRLMVIMAFSRREFLAGLAACRRAPQRLRRIAPKARTGATPICRIGARTGRSVLHHRRRCRLIWRCPGRDRAASYRWLKRHRQQRVH